MEECSFGNFVTDAMAAEMGVKIALINSGAIKGSFNEYKEANGKFVISKYTMKKSTLLHASICGFHGLFLTSQI